MKISILLAAVLAYVSVPPDARADILLPAILGSNMVVQQDQPLLFWGWADPGENVTIKIGDQQVGAAVGNGGDTPWLITVPPVKAGPMPDITIAGKNVVKLTNVLAGDVWLCSGQSNMAFAVSKATNGPAEVAAANYPQIRLFHVFGAVPSAKPGSTAPAPGPQADCKGKWEVCSPQSVAQFSAVGYFFGRDLQQKLNQPLGLIDSSVGGTPIEYWMDTLSLTGDPSFDPKAGYLAEYPIRMKVYDQYLASWKVKAAAAQAAGQPIPPQPPGPMTPDQLYKQFSSLYNTMIHPLLSYRLKGVIWYQGETNGQRPFQYRHLLTNMITSWRTAWQQTDLPFIIVQIANFDSDYLQRGAWADLREAQTQVAKETPHCSLVVTLDTGGPKGNLHPPDKQTPGQRCALSALKYVYGQDVVASGPTFVSAQFDGGKATVKLADLGSGLTTKDGQPPHGFTLAGADHIFYPADAEIQGDTVVVSSTQVPTPVAVRYGWADNPNCTLYNKEQLPAVPFRSDDWPGVTGPNGVPIPKPPPKPAAAAQP